MTLRLFVYGTLIPGGPNEHVLRAIGGTWQEAVVRGRLVSYGWGAEMGYPGLVLDDEGDEIQGYLFASDALADHWDALDAFEGEEYVRTLAPVRTDSGLVVEAYIYTLRRRQN